MSRSILAHLSFNFYRSCQADYRQALYRSSERLFMARISPASRPEFSYGFVANQQMMLSNQAKWSELFGESDDKEEFMGFDVESGEGCESGVDGVVTVRGCG